jgi:hypothetical protein
MINESQSDSESDSESTTQIAKAPNSIEQVHVSASGKIKIQIQKSLKSYIIIIF